MLQFAGELDVNWNTHAQTQRRTLSSMLGAVSVFCLVLWTGFQETFLSIRSVKHDLFKHKDTPKSFGFEVIRQRASSGVMAVFSLFLFFWRSGAMMARKGRSHQKNKDNTLQDVFFYLFVLTFNGLKHTFFPLSSCVLCCLFHWFSTPVDFLYFSGCYCKENCSHPPQSCSWLALTWWYV